MEHFAIINQHGKTIATASSMDIVQKYLDDAKNHSNYKKRKRTLELARRTYMNSNKPVDPGVGINKNSKELHDLKEILKKKPNLKGFLESELTRLTDLVQQEKKTNTQRRMTYIAEVANLQDKWVATLSPEDQYIWQGNWDHATEGYVPSFKKIQFLG